MSILSNLVFLIVVGLHQNQCHLFNSDVQELSPENFNDKVLNSKSVWIVMFFAPWCGHCKNFAPDFSKAATQLKGLVKFGSMDLDQHKNFGSQYQIRGFPTVKIFAGDKQKPLEYEGGRNAQAIAEKLSKIVSDTILERSGSSSRGSSSGNSNNSGNLKSKVFKLTNNDFHSTLTSKNTGWLVEFFAPWCGHCKNLEPHYNEASIKLEGIINMAAVDATVESQLASEFGVKGYPTIVFFQPGSSFKSSDAIPYDGGRTAEDIVNWVNSKLIKTGPPPEVSQLTSQQTFETACLQKSLCTLAFLPPIYDSSANERNEYLDILKTVASKERGIGGWLWAEGAVFEELEKVFGVGGYGYPALIIISNKKSIAIQFKGQFTAEYVSAFVKGALGSKVDNVVKFTKIPTIESVDAWNGLDYEPSQEL